MSASFDVILKSGTVVNQDGEGLRDLAIKDGRIAAIGDAGAVGRGVIASEAKQSSAREARQKAWHRRRVQRIFKRACRRAAGLLRP